MTNSLMNQVKKSVKAGNVQDQTQNHSGFERELIPERKSGWPARFIGYVEVGNRDGGEWQGKQKPPVRKAYLFFQLLSKKLAREIEVDGASKTIYPVQRLLVDVKTGEKANLTKLFNKMRYGREFTHVAEMLGEAFKVGVVHHEKKDANGAVVATYENSKTTDDGWLIFEPNTIRTDEDGEEIVVPLSVPEAREPIKLLLWDDPTPEQWDSIKGRPFEYGPQNERKTFDGGFYQYACIHEALDFSGSPLEAMLAGDDLPDMSVTDPEDEPAKDAAPTAPDDDDDDENMGLDDLPELD